ncbi:hypothetical protein SFV1gp55 [Sulfolobus filamentous virus 1]|uniref:Uncharacterized protein n=2 Tax=Alphalipothrixvirus beppuense TaxID=2734584 RepID=A0A346LU94_SUFV1|nr:hypothetical protein HOT91_gp55 [Sulfolobus filamentous virus 1]AXQ00137.1 hypothetical protein SFV1gp55 [Sulfolobus filamentous virus 1]AZI75757.1 hypothetical protein SBFV1_gp56 [Sulfolobales Beppu filamentous phage 1]
MKEDQLTIELPFEFVLYNGYSKHALKNYKGETMPSIGITNRYMCKIHKRIEYMIFLDIDKKVKLKQLIKFVKKRRAMITRTKYGYHIIIVTHEKSQYRNEIDTTRLALKMINKKIPVDVGHILTCMNNNRFILRIYGKYKDNPYVKIVYKKDDPILNDIAKLYEVTKCQEKSLLLFQKNL